MAQVPNAPRLTPDEFLVWEREQKSRHQYVHGDVFAMAGGSPRHNRLAARVIARLERGIEGGPCGAYSSDQKIGLRDELFVYADAIVVCGRPELRAGSSDVITNPAIVVEILSKGTETYDRGDKQRGYLELPSVRHFLLVAQREKRIELYTRQADGSFRFDVLGEGSTLTLEQITLPLSVDEFYEGVLDLPGD